ncbi:MAG: superoxide dismutase family protein [Micrococcus sp.]|nr:superoxide dismutase family protein [Micrococcus sp.]
MRHAPANTRARTTAALLGLAGMIALGACGNQGGEAGASASEPEVAQSATDAMPTDTTATGDTTSPDATAQTATATGTPAFTAALADVDGGEVGTVEFREAAESEESMEVHIQATGMEPGIYGLHVHAIGKCEPDSAAPDNPEETGAFLSAGGHLGGTSSVHPEHAGDLPVLLVQESGDGHLTVRTDRLTAEDLDDEDGSAVMIHSKPDNYANIPERYAADGPDEATTKAGDAGDRLACGVIESEG